jgi:hypothetical protein
LFLYLALWLGAFGMPAYWLAYERGRPAGTWFIVGLFLGPIALLMLGFAPARGAGRFDECPFCLEAVRLGAVRCSHCGSAMPV